MLDIAFAKPALPKSGALVLLIHEGEKASGLWAQLDEATGGAIARAFEVAEFKGGKGKTCTILAPGADLTRVLAVGLGKPADTTQKILEEAGGTIAATLSRETAVAVANTALTAATGGGGRARRGAAQLPLRPLPHQGKARGQAETVQADHADPRGSEGQGGVGAAGCHREGRVSGARPGQRAAQRARSARDGRTLPEADPNWA